MQNRSTAQLHTMHCLYNKLHAQLCSTNELSMQNRSTNQLWTSHSLVTQIICTAALHQSVAHAKAHRHLIIQTALPHTAKYMRNFAPPVNCPYKIVPPLNCAYCVVTTLNYMHHIVPHQAIVNAKRLHCSIVHTALPQQQIICTIVLHQSVVHAKSLHY